MFIVKKNINGRDYYYLRSSVRKNGRIKAVNIAYLGKNRRDAFLKAKEFMDKTGGKAEKSHGENNKSKDKARDLKEESLESKMTALIDKGKISQEKKELTIDELSTFCKRKGFVYPSAEIYGGLAGFWDFGHLGVELKNNIKQQWWNYHVQRREDMAGIDGAIITAPKVWEASGHVESFTDLAVVCKKCENKTKIDKHELGKAKCEKCGGEFESKGVFNPMFTTSIGPIKEDSMRAYLRPETAQLIFTNFRLVQENARMSLPFGIAQIGKAFRNEISPREFIFRCREFEQMEIEYFIAPDQSCPYKVNDTEISILSADMQLKNKEPVKMKISEALRKGIIKRDWHAYWIEQEFLWFLSLRATPDNFRIRQHLPDEKSHYSTDTWDLEYKFPMGWRELEGFADRSTYDLSQHQKFSGKSLEIVNSNDPKLGKVLPEVVCEPSLGVERAFIVFLLESYSYDSSRQNIILKLHPKLSPIKAAIFPIVKTDERVVKIAREIYNGLKEEFSVIYDDSGSVGRRYSRNDETGTPYCITTDDESIKKNDATIRDRNTTRQIRVKVKDLRDTIRKLINGEIAFEKAGKLVNTRVK